MSRMLRVTCHIPEDLLSQINAALNVVEYETFPHFVRISLLHEVQRRVGGSTSDAPQTTNKLVKTGRSLPSDLTGDQLAARDRVIEEMRQEGAGPVSKDDGRFGSLPPRGSKPPPVTEADIPPFLRRENHKP